MVSLHCEKKEVKKINGLYISTDGKKIETKNGTENDFMKLLCGSISEYLIDAIKNFIFIIFLFSNSL